jgi:hypothetical protein
MKSHRNKSLGITANIVSQMPKNDLWGSLWTDVDKLPQRSKKEKRRSEAPLPRISTFSTASIF